MRKYSGLVFVVLLAVVACEKKGDFEKAGEKIDKGLDKAAEKTGDGLNKAGDEIEKAGDKVKDAVD